jgi:hypothetical protein
MLLGFSVAALAAAVTAMLGCSAAGSSTVIVSGTDGGSEGGAINPFETDGGTNTGSDSGVASEDYEALFGAPSVSTTTPDSVFGLWAGQTSGNDMRVRFAKSSITVALKCGSAAAIGGSIAASVSSSAMKTLQSKTIGNLGGCYLQLTPEQIPSCASVGGASSCFTLTGTNLDVFGFLHVSGNLTKLSD